MQLHRPISGLNGKEIVRTFHEKELQKTNHEEFRIEKEIKIKTNKLYVRWQDYDNCLTAGSIKKGIVYNNATLS